MTSESGQTSLQQPIQVRIFGIWVDGHVLAESDLGYSRKWLVSWSAGQGHRRECWYPAEQVRFPDDPRDPTDRSARAAEAAWSVSDQPVDGEQSARPAV